jgi:hypothetical protein
MNLGIGNAEEIPLRSLCFFSPFSDKYCESYGWNLLELLLDAVG